MLSQCYPNKDYMSEAGRLTALACWGWTSCSTDKRESWDGEVRRLRDGVQSRMLPLEW